MEARPGSQWSSRGWLSGWSVALGLTVLVGASSAALAQAAQPDSTARLALQQGAQEMVQGHYTEAVADYTTVTRAMPQLAEGYLNLGLALQQTGQLDAAWTALVKARTLKPGLRGPNLFLGIIAYRQNRYAEAENNLLRETRMDPANAKAWMWLGVCDLAQGHPQSAIPPLDKAYALDPTDTDILYHRGQAYLQVSNASFAAMFGLNRDSMRVHQVLAEAYATGYRTEQAIAEFELTVKMAPREPGLHEELADQYWVAGQLDKAADAYREELAIDPYSVTALYKIGSLLVLNRDPSQGIEYLHKALAADSSISDAHYYLGTGLMNLNHSQEAIQEFHTTIAADPKDDRAMSSWYKLALLYRKLDDAHSAQDAMQNFLRMKKQVAADENRNTTQIVRDRASLPVEDPERAALTTQP